MKKYFWISVAILLLSIVSGAICPEWMEKPIALTLSDLRSALGIISKDNLNFFLFLLLKNLSVALFVIFVREILKFGSQLRQSLAKVMPFGFVRKALSVPVERVAKIIPVFILVVNGLIISGAVWYFSTEGLPTSVSVLGVLPHGIPELSALCLACGIGMSDVQARSRVNLFFRLVLPLFVLAAVLETWVSPQLMAWTWMRVGS
ncbi:MAG: stage II sporulation protein M [Peptococcaceae bacterium]|nr:stage II sporulation protein M [Peptococcaceae bacterium]